MNKILEKIIAKQREDLREKKKRVSLQDLRVQSRERRGSGLFYQAITKSINDPAVIAEVKFASPSGGDTSLLLLGEGQDEVFVEEEFASRRSHPHPAVPVSLRSQAGSSATLLTAPLKGEGVIDLTKDLLDWVKQYEEAGADAISIITEKHFFKGDLSFVTKAKKAVALPMLQKDFVIDEYQIYESARKGADALLLISRLVDGKTLKQFVELCSAEGVEPVVEVYSEEDLGKAVETEARFIAVNSRDLDTFEVDVKRACELMKKITDRFVRLGFSGIQSEDEVRQYKEAGARGVLIGTALMQARSTDEFLRGIGCQVREISKCKDQISKPN